MPYIAGDILRIEDVQLALGQTIRNVYFYEITETTGVVEAEDILLAFSVDVLRDVCGIQSTSIEHTSLKVDNVTDELSFGEIALETLVGEQPGAIMPTYVAFSFKLLRSSKLTRNGFKRIAGVPEDQVGGNFVEVPFRTSTEMTDVIAALQADIPFSTPEGSGSMRPVIASRPTPTRDFYVTQPVVGVELQAAITSQVSRKAGVGE